MLDIKYIKENTEYVKQRLIDKGRDCNAEIDEILALDTKRRELIASTESMKAEQNKVSKSIPALKKAGQDTAPVFAQMKELSDKVKAAGEELKAIEEKYTELMLSLPNMPDPDVVAGGKEANEPIRYYGEPHKFDFEPKNHVDICTDLGLIDYERGTKLWSQN